MEQNADYHSVTGQQQGHCAVVSGGEHSGSSRAGGSADMSGEGQREPAETRQEIREGKG